MRCRERTAGSWRHTDVVKGPRAVVVVAVVAAVALAAAGCAAGRAAARPGRTGSAPAPSASAGSEARPGPPVGNIVIDGPKLAFAAGTIGLDRSADGGRSWALSARAAGQNLRLDVVSRRVAFAAGQDMLLRTVNGGRSWQALRRPATGTYAVDFWSASAGVAMVPAPAGPGIRYFVTRDGGQS